MWWVTPFVVLCSVCERLLEQCDDVCKRTHVLTLKKHSLPKTFLDYLPRHRICTLPCSDRMQNFIVHHLMANSLFHMGNRGMVVGVAKGSFESTTLSTSVIFQYRTGQCVSLDWDQLGKGMAPLPAGCTTTTTTPSPGPIFCQKCVQGSGKLQGHRGRHLVKCLVARQPQIQTQIPPPPTQSRNFCSKCVEGSGKYDGHTGPHVKKRKHPAQDDVNRNVENNENQVYALFYQGATETEWWVIQVHIRENINPGSLSLAHVWHGPPTLTPLFCDTRKKVAKCGGAHWYDFFEMCDVPDPIRNQIKYDWVCLGPDDVPYIPLRVKRL